MINFYCLTAFVQAALADLHSTYSVTISISFFQYPLLCMPLNLTMRDILLYNKKQELTKVVRYIFCNGNNKFFMDLHKSKKSGNYCREKIYNSVKV